MLWHRNTLSQLNTHIRKVICKPLGDEFNNLRASSLCHFSDNSEMILSIFAHLVLKESHFSMNKQSIICGTNTIHVMDCPLPFASTRSYGLLDAKQRFGTFNRDSHPFSYNVTNFNS